MFSPAPDQTQTNAGAAADATGAGDGNPTAHRRHRPGVPRPQVAQHRAVDPADDFRFDHAVFRAVAPGRRGYHRPRPAPGTLLVVRVLYDSSRHALAKPAREVLFTHLDREQRYKSKAFIDAAVYRGGDLLSGWIYAALAALGMTVGAIALTAAPVAVLWALLGRRLSWVDRGSNRPE